MTYGVGAASDITGVGGAVNETGGAATGIDEAVTTGAAGAGATTVGEDVPLVVPAVLARPVAEPSP